MTDKKVRTVVVMPAYNAATTLQSTYVEIPQGVVDKVILVDDFSQDSTVELAESLDIDVIRHPHNVGYGGNQKTCYMEALRQGADVVVMLHPDGQYDPTVITTLVERIRGGADIVLASRFLDSDAPRKGGMPWWKRVANRSLTKTENTVLGTNLSEMHTGYRCYSRRFLETIPFMRNSDNFVFDTLVLVQAVAFGFTIEEVPVSVRYFPEASSVGFSTSVVYGLETLWVLTRYILHRAGLRSRLFSR